MRTRQQYLLPDEIDTIRRYFRLGMKPKEVSERIGCAKRTIGKYFGYFRAEGETVATHARPHIDTPDTTGHRELTPWQPPSFVQPHAYPDVVAKLRWGRA